MKVRFTLTLTDRTVESFRLAEGLTDAKAILADLVGTLQERLDTINADADTARDADDDDDADDDNVVDIQS